MKLREYYRGKKVFITGHTGFKGGWLTKWLLELGAIVSGVSLPKDNDEAMFYLLDLDKKISHYEFDIREKVQLEKTLLIESPEIIFHLAAQPLVLESYSDPYYTHLVNYVGTLNLLEVIRNNNFCQKIFIITSDKVYKPLIGNQPLTEDSALGGIDPYSSSKSAVEILVSSYRESYFDKTDISCITFRAGNVIGYGDWGRNRLLPDIFRSIILDNPLYIRNPKSIRPWQDVNDICYGYLSASMKSKSLLEENIYSLNFGPNKTKYTVLDIIEICKSIFPDIHIQYLNSSFIETNELILDSSMANEKLGWSIRNPLIDSIQQIFKLLSLHNDSDLIGLEEEINRIIKEYLN